MERYRQGIPSSTGWWRGRRRAQRRSPRRKGRERAREQCVEGVPAGGSDGANGTQRRLHGHWGPAQERVSLVVD